MVHMLPADLTRHVAGLIAAQSHPVETARAACAAALAGLFELAGALWCCIDPGCDRSGPARRPGCWVRRAARRKVLTDAVRIIDPRRVVAKHGLSADAVAPFLRPGEVGLRRGNLSAALRRGTSHFAPSRAVSEIRAIRQLVFTLSVPPEVRDASWIVRDCECDFVRTESRVAFALAMELSDNFRRVLAAAHAEGLRVRRAHIADLVVVRDLPTDRALAVARECYIPHQVVVPSEGEAVEARDSENHCARARSRRPR